MNKGALAVTAWLALVAAFSSLSAAQPASDAAPAGPCEAYEQARARLEAIAGADQQARRNPPRDETGWRGLLRDDESRRVEVAALFAKGCLRGADDYLQAAMVFQHGEVPDHIYQAFLWSQRAYEMGLKPAAQWRANAIDRYLMLTNRKQLFGTQAKSAPVARDQDPTRSCMCLWPVETSFPDARRAESGVPATNLGLAYIKMLNSGKPDCKNEVCPVEAKAVEMGSLPGMW